MTHRRGLIILIGALVPALTSNALVSFSALAQELPALDETQVPSIEMLEFLGGWENEDGSTEDPLFWKEFFENDIVERPSSDFEPQFVEDDDDE